jgi:16S rRNA (guanine(966)-N(2))-methyltransferase RsmD
MRITGGQLKGRFIPAKFAHHVRPSTDRVRESLFNSLEHQKGISETHVLDLFSGSGIIALEFLSRNAHEVYSIDLDKKNTEHQKTIAKEWDLQRWYIASGNALTAEQTLTKNKLFQTQGLEVLPKFDFIFADPPYGMANIQGLPKMLIPLLAEDGWLIIEHKPQLVFAEQELLKKEYGSTTMTIFALP